MADSRSESGLGEPAGDPASTPLVSVCMAAFNAERFVGAAIGSILDQTYPHLEVLVVDDASTDRTYDIASSFVDRRLRVWRAPAKRGAFQAMNDAAAQARGEFVAIYHADDIYEPTMVEKEVAHLRAHPEVGGVFTLDHNIDENGRRFATIRLPAEFAGRASLDFDTVLRYEVRKKNPFCCPTFMTRRTVLHDVGVFNPERWDIVADVDLWLRIARRFPLALLDEPLVHYRKGRHQWTARHRRLRTEPDPFFAVIDDVLATGGARQRLSPEDFVEYAFQRCDDAAFRAAHCVMLDRTGEARELLRSHPYPWATLRAGVTRRKLRLVALRALIQAGLMLGVRRPLARVLRHLGP